MKKRWPIFLIALVWLASLACQSTPAITPVAPTLAITPPATTPTASTPASPEPPLAALRAALERLRPQVFHQPHNASEQEVMDSPTTAGQGDRVRIPGLGKALLKWPDLHVMLYLRTELEAKDVTPNWIRLGILAGTTVTGGKLQPDQRLALYTDYAEIMLTGTTVMVTYHPETGLTIVRVFEGQAQVRNLEGAPRVAPVRSGEWALVGPGEAPQVSGDLTAMRGLARDLGLWDVFHEAELDVQGGFGTEQSRVPPSNVEIVFVEGQETVTPATSTGTPTGTPTLTGTPMPTSTPTPTKTLTPARTPTPSRMPTRTRTPTKPPPAPPKPSRPGLITDFEVWGKWTRGNEQWGTFVQSKEQVKAGSYAGKFTYDFPSVSNNYVVYRQNFPITGSPSALQAWVYGDGSTNYLNAWVQDASGQLWQFTFGRINHTGWQQMVAPLDLGSGWPNQAINNPNAKAVKYPIKFSALVLDGWREDTALRGTIYIDELFAVYGAAPPPPPGPGPQACPAKIGFTADRTALNAGECTWLHWSVDNVKAVYLDGQGVTGHEDRQVCPTTPRSYQLTVTCQDGTQAHASVAIDVRPGSAPPPTSYLRCSPDRTIIDLGACTVLHWESGGVQAVYLDGAGVTGREDRTVCPSEPHLYKLRAVTGAGDLFCEMAVDVGDRTPPEISDIHSEPIPGLSSGHMPPYCYDDKLYVLARVTDKSSVKKVEIWIAVSGEWNGPYTMGSEDGQVWFHPIRAGNDFKIRAEDEWGNVTETPAMPTECVQAPVAT